MWLRGVPRNVKKYFFTLMAVSTIVTFGAIYMSFDFSNKLLIDTTHKQLCIRKNYTHLMDYNRLMGMPFQFVYLPRKCGPEMRTMIVIIHSAPDNFNKRLTIRRSWGLTYDDPIIYFLIGLTKDQTIVEELQQEYEDFRDIIQGSFVDAYKNLTYKHVTALKYVVYHCPNVKYLLKTDDDIFINMPALLTFLDIYNTHSIFDKENLICRKWRTNPVQRYGKWKVSRKEYPYENYPIHCAGSVIIYPRDTVFRLYQQAQISKYFWIDDVFVTGIVAESACIGFTNIKQLRLERDEIFYLLQYEKMKVEKVFLYGSNNLPEFVITLLWDYVVKHPTYVNASVLDDVVY